MLVTALATSTGYGYWGFHLVARVLEQFYGSVLHIHCLDLPQLRNQWDERKSRPVLVTSDRPETALSVMLTSSGCPIVAFFDEAFDAMAHCMLVDGRTASDSARFCSSYFSALAGCMSTAQVRVFGPECFGERVRDFVTAVAEAIGAPLDADAVAHVVEAVAPAERFGADPIVESVQRQALEGETLAEAAARRLAPADRDLLSRVAASYAPILAGAAFSTVEWPRELFQADVEDGATDMDVKLMGRARHIYWGPYLHLPVGRWRTCVRFEVSGNASGNGIEGDICIAMTQVAKATARLPERGYFQFELEFANKDPNQPIEVRIGLLKGAIEGKFGLRRVTVEPIATLTGAVASAAEAARLAEAKAAHA